MFKKDRSHIYLHQLGMVEREAGNYQKALKLYEQERQLIGTDSLAAAANLYGFGKNNELLGKIVTAKNYSDRCIKISLKCRDNIMKACAFRLAGDIERHRTKNMATMFYKKAKLYFQKAADARGTQEIDSLLKQLR